MIIDCISDLHGYLPKLEGGDLLIIAGDLTARDTYDEYMKFWDWLDKVDYKKKIVISGNHDNYCYEVYKAIPESIIGKFSWPFSVPNMEYLCDSGTEYEGFKIWGSPWTSQFPGMNPACMAFTVPYMQSLKDKWDMIPDDVDILITHSPPFGILDQIPRNFNASSGDVDLLKTLHERIKPKLHVFGHIHEQGGKQLVFKRPGYSDENNTICVNANIMNERFPLVNKPVRIIL